MNWIGQAHLPTEIPRSTQTNSFWAAADLEAARGMGAPPGTLASMTADLERAKRVDAGIESDPGAILIEILNAQNRSAPAEYVATLQKHYERASQPAKPRSLLSSKRIEELEARTRTRRRSWFRQAVVVAGLLSPAWLTFLVTRER